MSGKPKRIPYYRHKRASVSGVEAKLHAGDPAGDSATWDVAAASLGGVTPAAGGEFGDVHGNRWSVLTVEAVGGGFRCGCERAKGGDS